MNKLNKYSQERIEKFVFEKNWIEPPLFYNNKDKVLRFDLDSKSETKSVELIENIFKDLFFKDSDMLVVFYGSKYCKWQNGKRYFKRFSLKKVFQKKYISKDVDDQETIPFLVACLTNRKQLNLIKYLSEYLEDEQSCQMAFISLKKEAAIQLYDSRGFDLLSSDKNFLKMIYENYEEYIIEYNRQEIIESLKN